MENTIFSKAGSGSDKGKESGYMYEAWGRKEKKEKGSNHYTHQVESMVPEPQGQLLGPPWR
jgi:hypothetical protein